MDSIEKNKVALIALLLLVLAGITLVIFKGILPGWNDETADFSNYYTASRLLLEGESVEKFYDNAWFEEQAHRMNVTGRARFTPFPPVTSVLALPLTFFEPLQAKRIWLLLNVVLLFTLIAQLRMITNLSFTWVLAITFIVAMPLASNFRMGQFYLALTCGLLAAYQAAIHNRAYSAGNLLALITLFKYFPFTLIPAFAVIGNRKVWLTATVTFGLLMIGQIFFFGVDTWTTYMHILTHHLHGDIPGQGRFIMAFQSVDAFLSYLFVFDEQLNPSPLINNVAMQPIIKGLFATTVAGLGIYTIYTCRNRNKRTRRDVILIVVSLGTLLVLPASATYHMIILLFPMTLLYRLGKEHLRRIDLIILFLLVAVAANTSFHTIAWVSGWSTLDLILSFPRLWALCALYTYINWWLARSIRTRNVENLVYG